MYSDSGYYALKQFGMSGIKLFFLPRLIRRSIRGSACSHGIGRLDRVEVLEWAKKDVQAVADVLGNKRFMMSDEQLYLVDCSAFGTLGTLLYSFPSDTPLRAWIEEELPMLAHYVDRVRDRLFPDWNELISADSIAAERQRARRAPVQAPLVTI